VPSVISLVQLLERDGDPLTFDPGGAGVTMAVKADRPAVLIVEPVADALKRVSEGRVIGAVDRETVERVVAFSVDRGLLESMGPGELAPEELIESVRRRGHTWERRRLG
jgi:hypothetical protein